MISVIVKDFIGIINLNIIMNRKQRRNLISEWKKKNKKKYSIFSHFKSHYSIEEGIIFCNNLSDIEVDIIYNNTFKE